MQLQAVNYNTNSQSQTSFGTLLNGVSNLSTKELERLAKLGNDTITLSRRDGIFYITAQDIFGDIEKNVGRNANKKTYKAAKENLIKQFFANLVYKGEDLKIHVADVPYHLDKDMHPLFNKLSKKYLNGELLTPESVYRKN